MSEMTGRARRLRGASSYDAVVVGARCAGSPTAMLLARQVLGAMHGHQQAMDGFVSVQAGTLPAPDFFAPENLGRIMAHAAPAR
jgi:small ligand-binding sensory domain FIST